MLVGADQLAAAVSVQSVARPELARLAEILFDFNWLCARTGGAAVAYTNGPTD